MRLKLFPCAAALALTAWLSAPAAAQPKFGCGGINPHAPTIQPVTFPTLAFSETTNLSVDCSLWQDFVYLNWPALAGNRGTPNTAARFGAPGATVWETFKTVNQIFLPNAKDPGPWQQGILAAYLPNSLAQQIAQGSVRELKSDSKVTRQGVAALSKHHFTDPTVLNEIEQAFNTGILYDQRGQPAYYELLMNQDEYNYTRQYKLYDAVQQNLYAQTNVISVPTGKTSFGPYGAMEVKAAWKILTPAEAASGRFHTAKAIIPGLTGLAAPITVGLVGLHVVHFFDGMTPGAWGTFAQVDNVPVAGAAGKGPYSFNNPACTGCPVNDPSTDPTQAVQVFPDDVSAVPLNAYMQGLIAAYSAQYGVKNSPWRYYKLVNVQWPFNGVKISAPAPIPLPNGNPQITTLTNAVLETFIQQNGTSCLACHVIAPVAPLGTKAANIASGYSFLFQHAQMPAK